MTQTKPTIPVLHAPRLTLRRVTRRDAPHLLPITTYGGVPARTLADGYRVLRLINADIQKGQSLHWGIEWRETGEVVGTIGFYRGFAGRTGEVGYILAPSFRRQGITHEALLAVVAYGFGPLQLERIVAYTAADNAASAGILLKAAFAETPSDLPPYRKFVLAH